MNPDSGKIEDKMLAPALEFRSEQLGFFKTSMADTRASSVLHMVGLILSRPGHLAVFMFRLSAFLYKKGKIGWVLAAVISRLNLIFSGCEISPLANIAPGFELLHSRGVVIGPATIGKNARIYQNVAIGSKRYADSSGKRAVIGDNVRIYAGAIVIGNIHIGNNVSIGANAVVDMDVGPDAIVKIPAMQVLSIRKRKED